MPSTQTVYTRLPPLRPENRSTDTNEHTPAPASKRTCIDDPDDNTETRTSKRIRRLKSGDTPSPSPSPPPTRAKIAPAALRRRTPLPSILLNPTSKTVPKITLQPPSPQTSTRPPPRGHAIDMRRDPPDDPALLHPMWRPEKKSIWGRRSSWCERHRTASTPTAPKEEKQGESSHRPLTDTLRFFRQVIDRVVLSKKLEGKEEESKAPESVASRSEDSAEVAEGDPEPNIKISRKSEEANTSPQASKTEPKPSTLAKTPEGGPSKAEGSEQEEFVFSDEQIDLAADCLLLLSSMCDENPTPDAATRDTILEVINRLPDPITHQGRRDEPKRAEGFMGEVRKRPGMESWGDVKTLDMLDRNLRMRRRFSGRATALPTEMQVEEGESAHVV